MNESKFETYLELLENAIDNKIKDPELLNKFKKIRFSLIYDSIEPCRKLLFIGLYYRYKEEFKTY